MNENLLKGQPLRDKGGDDNGIRVLDADNDGFMDVVIGTKEAKVKRVRNPSKREWAESRFPEALGRHHPEGESESRWGITGTGRPLTAYVPGIWQRDDVNMYGHNIWTLRDREWRKDDRGSDTFFKDHVTFDPDIFTDDLGFRFRAMDHDGVCELIVANQLQQAVFKWSESEHEWKKLDGAWPKRVAIVNEHGEDNGVRFVDVNGDG